MMFIRNIENSSRSLFASIWNFKNNHKMNINFFTNIFQLKSVPGKTKGTGANFGNFPRCRKTGTASRPLFGLKFSRTKKFYLLTTSDIAI